MKWFRGGANTYLRERNMVTKCANPSCGASFQYLRGGKLFLVDLPRRPVESEGGTQPPRTAEYFLAM
jgi:hypothetical protein